MSISIGIDIDGTAINSYGYWKKVLAPRYGVTADFLSTYNGIWKAPTNDGRLFGEVLFGEAQEEWLEKAEPFNDAVAIVNKLAKHENVFLYFVTARHIKLEVQTSKALNNHGFSIDIPVIHTQNKLEAPIQVLVDDKPKTIEEFASNARMAFVMDAPYNKDVTVGRRINNLSEFYEQILPYL